MKAWIEKWNAEHNHNLQLEVRSDVPSEADRAIAEYRNTRAVISPHGGMMYAMVFMPPDTLVIEVHPLLVQSDGSKREGWNPELFYVAARSLGHRYHVVPSLTTDPNFRMDSREGSIIKILDREILFEGEEVGSTGGQSPVK